MQVDFVVESNGVDEAQLQKTYADLSRRVVKSERFFPYSVSWLNTFQMYCKRKYNLTGDIANDKFQPLLKEFLNSTSGHPFLKDISLQSPGGRGHVSASRLIAWQRPSRKTADLLDAMAAAQSIAEESATSGEDIHAYSYKYRYLHQVQLVREKGHITILVSLAVVAVVTWFFFEGNLFGAMFCTVLIGAVNFELVGFMSFWGLEYNHASHTALVTGIGFSVDYIAHVVLAFARSKGTAEERVRFALTQMGPAVFSGALSTFLGILALGFGEVATSRIFFKLIFLLITFSAFHGLALSPVVLLYVCSALEQSDTDRQNERTCRRR